MNEKMSAWMDDELNRFEERALIEDLEKNPQLRARWERYHLAREAIRHELETMAPRGFAERVGAGLRALAPVRRPRRLARLGGTLAIAASVAVIALVGIQFLPGQSPDGVPGTVATAPTAPPRTASAQWQNRPPEQTRHLNVYLVEHNEFSSSNSVGGMFPYVRTVSQGNDARTK
ncbi:MAG: sigma-E factor negative regulatory protein [Pseudomonadota bacterium]